MAVTLQQIADRAGVSRGTVDRALNNRGRIRPEVAERIKVIAKEMGYKPNAGGRALALLKQRRVIGVIEQFAETPFIIELDAGVRAAQEEVDRYGCDVELRRVDGVDTDKVVEYMREMRDSGVSGIALVATDHERIRKEIRTCSEAGIPVVTFNSDIVGSDRIAYIGQDAWNSGRASGALMLDILPAGGEVAILSGTKSSTIQESRIRGFQNVFHKARASERIVSIHYTNDTVSGLKEQTETLLERHPNLAGIYMSTQGKNELCAILKEKCLDQKIRLIVHDLVACQADYIHDGTINYVIDEDSYIQGYEPVMTLFRLLYNGRNPEKEMNYTEIKIISRYNLTE